MTSWLGSRRCSGRKAKHARVPSAQAKKDKSFYRTLAIDGKRRDEERAKRDKKDSDKRQ